MWLSHSTITVNSSANFIERDAEPSVKAELYTNGGGKIGYAFIYFPDSHCAVCYSVEDCREMIKKLSEELFWEQINELNIDLSAKQEVKMDQKIVSVIQTEDGTFDGLDEYSKLYNNQMSPLWCAMNKAIRLCFRIRCEK